LAVAFSGATQHRKLNKPTIGKAYSGKNCHKIINNRTSQNTFICFRESGPGFSRCFFWVLNNAVWQSLRNISSSDNNIKRNALTRKTYTKLVASTSNEKGAPTMDTGDQKSEIAVREQRMNIL
jgi:hypothetical protein